MLIYGLIKVRSEEKIIQETLDHWGKICTGGIFVYDDVSTDKTLEICRRHPAVKEIIENKEWDYDRERHEWMARQAVLNRAKPHAKDDDWFVYFDADERIFFDDWALMFNKKVDAIACRLYDVYITEEDKNEVDHNKRNMVGPEFRTIPFFFRNSPYLSYNMPDQRIVNLRPGAQIVISGKIKHFGKGLSIDQWENTCKYYMMWPKYHDKWEARVGKAVHKLSDFDNKLINFNDVLSGREEGFSLENQVYGKS